MIINEENSRASTFELANWVRQRHLAEPVAGEHAATSKYVYCRRSLFLTTGCTESGITYAELLNFTVYVTDLLTCKQTVATKFGRRQALTLAFFSIKWLCTMGSS